MCRQNQSCLFTGVLLWLFCAAFTYATNTHILNTSLGENPLHFSKPPSSAGGSSYHTAKCSTAFKNWLANFKAETYSLLILQLDIHQKNLVLFVKYFFSGQLASTKHYSISTAGAIITGAFCFLNDREW